MSGINLLVGVRMIMILFGIIVILIYVLVYLRARLHFRGIFRNACSSFLAMIFMIMPDEDFYLTNPTWPLMI